MFTRCLEGPGDRSRTIVGATLSQYRARDHSHSDSEIPLGVLVVVTGVAGSGKSPVIHGSVSGRDDGVVSVDQAAIKSPRRSNPATYPGMLDPMPADLVATRSTLTGQHLAAYVG